MLSYFVKGELPKELGIRRVKLFSAPITNPSSMGLSEQYVQMVSTGLRTVLAHENQLSTAWDQYLDTVVFSINTRMVKVHGFTPSQLFMGFNPRGEPENITVRDEMIVNMNGSLEAEGIEQWHQCVNMERIEEMREIARKQVKERQEIDVLAQEERIIKRGITQPMKDDLVLLRRFTIDKEKGSKLEHK